MKINYDDILLAEQNWEKYQQFKKTTQANINFGEFDEKLTPIYEYIQKNGSTYRAVIFNIYMRKKVFPILGIE